MSESPVFKCRWFELTSDFYDSIVNAKNEQDEWNILVNICNIGHAEDNLRSKILLEFIFHNLHFCRESQYNYQQAVGFISVVINIFEIFCIQNINDTKDNAVKSFNEMLQGIVLSNYNIFLVQDVQNMTVFFSRTLLRNLTSYRYCMNEYMEEKPVNKILSINTPFIPMPFETNTNIDKQDEDNQ